LDATTALKRRAIADYDVVEQLGEGAHGRSYLARPPQRPGLPDDLVVLKVRTDRVSEQAFDRGVHALWAVASVPTARVVRVFEALHQDGFGYAMEHHPLGSLAAPARSLTRAEILAALADAALAAHALHEAGLVHGGIKPSNVLLVEEPGGELRGSLADPDLTRALAPGAVLTGTGRVSAAEFTDPDLLAGARPSRRTEVWALGATVHRALGGAGLHGELPDDDPLAAIRRLLSTRPQVNAGLESAEAALVRDCIADGSARIGDAAEVADRLATLRAAT
jgi:serine/threonine protein kinase